MYVCACFCIPYIHDMNLIPIVALSVVLTYAVNEQPTNQLTDRTPRRRGGSETRHRGSGRTPTPVDGADCGYQEVFAWPG